MPSDPRRANSTKRNKVRKRVLREERICHLCDQWVDVTLPHGLPGSPEADELVPVTYGGDPFDRSGIRLAHRHCNRLRWHGPVNVAREKLANDRPVFGADGRLVTTELRPIASRRWL